MELFRLFGTIALHDDQARRGLENIDRQGERTGSRLGGFFKSAGGMMGAAVVAGAAAAGAGLLALGGVIGKTGIAYNSMMENSAVAWETLLGTQKEAQAMLSDIGKFAKNTQFETGQVDMMAKYMHNAGLEGKALFDELTKVADISGAFNIPAHEAEELTRQMSQVRQAGLAYTEDLNVLQDRGIPIYKAISEQLGITVGDVKKMASQGKLTSDIYLKAFDKIAKSVEGSAEKQSKTLTGMMSTLKDNLSMISGELMKGAFERLKGTLSAIMPIIERFSSTLKDKGLKAALSEIFPAPLVNTVTAISDAIGFMGDGLKAVYDMMLGTGDMTWFVDNFGLEKAVAINNFLWNLVDYIKKIYDTVSSYFPIVKEVALDVFNAVIEVVSTAWNFFKTNLLPIFKDLFNWVMGHMPTIRATVQQVFNKITEVVRNAWSFFKNNLLPILASVYGWVQAHMPQIKSIIETAFTVIKNVVEIAWGIFENLLLPALKKLWEWIEPHMPAIKKAISENMEKVVEAIQFVVDVFDAVTSAIKLALDWLGRWNNKEAKKKTVTVEERRVSTGDYNIGRNYTGTSNFRGGATWVGEHGPEIVELPKNTKIHSANDSRAMTQQETVRQPIIIQSILNGRVIAEETIDDISILLGAKTKMQARKGGVVFG
ncbi:tape measure protein [Mesobacillus subterraneus]|uniref:tape measure protein n=1 Tax=Mesobacillus subterraneus TaxID=285983 RepID=UPI00203B1794|nr:tape measure protein [Mesobacillus subterraneus]MCM3665507.1 tape measure protein [Mesobacillus subterraneus]MCM3686066.1 tape measure protein [Mesobacillus subterraneus]